MNENGKQNYYAKIIHVLEFMRELTVFKSRGKRKQRTGVNNYCCSL